MGDTTVTPVFTSPTVPASSPLPTIAPDWSQASSCQDTTQWQKVWYTSDHNTNLTYLNNVFAVPTLNGMSTTFGDNCLPPSFSLNQPYVTDGGCPSGYTEQCRTSSMTYQGQYAELFTCCPR